MTIMVDVDGTMYQTVGILNETIVELVKTLKRGEATVYAWSGGGAEYAKRIVTTELKLPENLFDGYLSKEDANLFKDDIDITIDDEDYCKYGKVNLKIIKTR